MRQFSILVIFVLAFGGAAVLYEKESRKVKGVLTQLTELQAQLGDLQAEVSRLNEELEAAKLAERRRPSLKAIASRIRSSEHPSATVPVKSNNKDTNGLVASDVTSAPPAIDAGGDEEEAEWNRPTVDAEQYRAQQEPVTDPYQ